MASYYTDTNLESAVARFIGSFEGGMNRNPFTEFLKKLYANANYLMPDAEMLKQSSKRAIKAKIMKTIIEDATGTRSCTLSGTYGNGTSTTLNWSSVALTGAVSRKQHQDNEFALQEAIAKRIADLRKSCLTTIETAAQAWFEANKTTINDATSFGTFDAGTNVFEVDPLVVANPGFLNVAEQMLAENRYRGAMNAAVVNGFTYPQLRYQSQQGAGNAANTAFQFGNWDISNGLGYSDDNYPNWFAFVFQAGLVGALSWIPEDYRNPRQGASVADAIGVKQSFPDPEIPGLIWAMKSQLTCANTVSYNGGDDDEVLNIQLSTDYTFNYAPTEDGSTPIYAIGTETVAP